MPDLDSPAHERAHAILETLADASPATTAELATRLETHPVTVERHCRALQRAGHVRQCAGGVYTLVESTVSTQSAVADSPADHADQRTTNPAD